MSDGVYYRKDLRSVLWGVKNRQGYVIADIRPARKGELVLGADDVYMLHTDSPQPERVMRKITRVEQAVVNLLQFMRETNQKKAELLAELEAAQKEFKENGH